LTQNKIPALIAHEKEKEMKKKIKVSVITKFINEAGVPISQPAIHYIARGKEMSFNKAHEFSKVFKDKDIVEWKKTKGKDFKEYFAGVIPLDYIKSNSLHKSHKKPGSHSLAWKRGRLIERYGKEIIDDLKKVKAVPLFTLQYVADKYGFSREYARQIYKNTFGEKYTVARKKKERALKIKTSCQNDPRHKVADFKRGSSVHIGAIAEKLFMCRCDLLGHNVTLFKDKLIDIQVNGKTVDVKSSKQRKGPYHRFCASKKQTEVCDFFACYVFEEDSFYIVPNKKKGELKAWYLYIPKKQKKHKYSKFKNRFDLLSNTKEVLNDNTQ
jgi:hypothetical protein